MEEGIWPVTVAGWIALLGFALTFLGSILVYFKGWVIFRHSIDERFKAVEEGRTRIAAQFTESVERIVDDVIGLPRNTTVKGEINGIGKRIDQVSKENEERDKFRREKLSEFFQAQSKIRDMDNAIQNLSDRVAELRGASDATLAEVRALTRDTSTRLEGINRELTIISTEFKHIQRQAAAS